MSTTVTCKCPNCGGGLVFSPQKQQFVCEYCGSAFSQAQLDALTPDAQVAAPPAPDATQTPDSAATQDAAVYSCPSCGAEIVTDATTAATYCYFCHNPVVLAGKLEGRLRPDKVVPFAIDREQAVTRFREWIGKKWFVPPAFFSKAQIEKLTGVYFPHWVTDMDVDARLDTSATKVRTWRTGNTEFTETSHFRIVREGSLHFEDMETVALQKVDKKLLEGIQPFNGTAAQPFNIGFLSGFQAEKRDMERADVQAQVQQEATTYSDALLRDTISGYTTIAPKSPGLQVIGEQWDYVLMPVWLLTYRDHAKKLYYFAMNGQTGKTFGLLPIDKGRLALLFAGVSVPLLLLILGVLLW